MFNTGNKFNIFNDLNNKGNDFVQDIFKKGMEAKMKEVGNTVGDNIKDFTASGGAKLQEGFNKVLDNAKEGIKNCAEAINNGNIFDTFNNFNKTESNDSEVVDVTGTTTNTYTSTTDTANLVTLKVSKLYRDVLLPKKRVEDSGYDVCAYLGNRDYVRVMPGETIKIGTGLSFEIPYGYDLKVYSRSSTGYNGLISMAMIIDQGYQGEAHLSIFNSSNKPIVIVNKNYISNLRELHILNDIATVYTNEDGIFQFILEPRVDSNLEVVNTDGIHLRKTARGNCGFGSTSR